MGLTPRPDPRRAGTAALLGLAAALQLALPRPDPREAVARRLLGGAAVRLEIGGQPAFRAGARWVVFFEGPGQVDRIAGAIVIEHDAIVDLQLLHSREGIDRAALSSARVGSLYRGRPARAPVEVQSVTGASVSSRRLADCVDRRLAEWRAAVR